MERPGLSKASIVDEHVHLVPGCSDTLSKARGCPGGCQILDLDVNLSPVSGEFSREVLEPLLAPRHDQDIISAANKHASQISPDPAGGPRHQRKRAIGR